MKFDVHKAGMIGGLPIGEFIETIEAVDHSAAKLLVLRTLPGLRVVVLPNRPTTEKLERALRRVERQRVGARSNPRD
jgi:hypothetical protein